MKTCFFHLMPYQGLPKDFTDHHKSAWVDLPNENFDPSLANGYYGDFLEELEYADNVGFDGICVNEHHSNAYGMMPSPNLLASILSRSTSNSALIVLGNSIALYQPPLRVAEEMAMLDVLSGGRLVSGFPVGTSMDTAFSYGVVPLELRERHNEAHDLIMKSWKERKPFSFNGKYNQIRYVNVWPRPMQQPHPPVWIPGSGTLETWDWVLDRNYVYCYLSYYGYMRAQKIVDGFWARAAEKGVDDNPHRLGFLQLVCVSETDESAKQEYEEHVKYFYEKMLRIHTPYAEAPGYRPLTSIRESLRPQMATEAAKVAKDMEWEDYIELGYIIAGSPETVTKKLSEAVDMLRIGHLMTLLQIGSMPKDLTLKNTRLFAEHVMPEINKKWPDYKDNWWPSNATKTNPLVTADD